MVINTYVLDEKIPRDNLMFRLKGDSRQSCYAQPIQARLYVYSCQTEDSLCDCLFLASQLHFFSSFFLLIASGQP